MDFRLNKYYKENKTMLISLARLLFQLQEYYKSEEEDGYYSIAKRFI